NNGFISGVKGILLATGSNIQTFTNKGTLQGSEAGVETGGTIDNFTNSGLIKSPSSGKWNNGIWMNGTSRIKTFTNKGTIEGGSGIVVSQNATVENLTNTGTIKSKGNIEPNLLISYSSGISFREDTLVKTFTNTGLISANISGIILGRATIDNFNNTGTIESTSNHERAAAVSLLSVASRPSYIKTFTNEGVLKSNSQGIITEAGNKIDTIINKGTIEAGLNGISFFTLYDGSSGAKVDLGNIILEKGSSIKAGNNGINIDGTSNKPIIVSGSIEVKKGASVSGNNAGIVIGSGKEVSAQITVEGSVTGGAAGIVNEGTIGSSSSSEG
ncbi:autotransporter outer membrane beta-barrel domain-containing protein, partial [Campylobacter jejuni]|nr:autotransporter outer membrane beta-barrel domain-containing protein [Campylobacter jejuni]